jgi:hypothetical protein
MPVEGLDEIDFNHRRSCVNCNSEYSIAEFWNFQTHYFPPPHRYSDGCVTHCLTCWLGCGPDPAEPEGDILRECGHWLTPDVHLAVMPLARVSLDLPFVQAGLAAFYPPRWTDLSVLNPVANSADSGSLRESCNAASRVDAELIEAHAIIAFPVSFQWETLWKTSYQNNLDFIRGLSERADRLCLDAMRFHLCQLAVPDAVPARAGQLDSNHMMAGALLYNAAKQEARVLGGAAFTHIVTVGLGLPLHSLSPDNFPQAGGVGNIVKHALALYSDLLETNSETAKFIQSLGLLEFLAIPDNYAVFKKVSAIVRRYLTEDDQENLRLKERFNDLTGRRDPATKEYIGYRTRIVHIGDRLADILPETEDRKRLFEELDGYIRALIHHMIIHSALDWDSYKVVRDRMGVAGRLGAKVDSELDD